MLKGTLEDAVEKLAALAVERRARPISWQEKQAETPGWLTGLGGAVQNNPALAATLLGGAAGAGISGLRTSLTNRNKDERDRRSVLRSMITGGLGGAALGGGGALAYGAVNGLRSQPATENTELLENVRRLTAEPPFQQQAARAMLRPLGTAAAAATGVDLLAHASRPIRSTLGQDTSRESSAWNAFMPSSILPKVGLIDALAHMPGYNLGERIGFGRVRPEYSTNPAHLRAGVAGVGEADIGANLRAAIVGSDARTTSHQYTPYQRNDPTRLEASQHGPDGHISTPVPGGQSPSEAVARSLANRGRPQGFMDFFKRLVRRPTESDDILLSMEHTPRMPGKDVIPHPSGEHGARQEVPTTHSLSPRTERLRVNQARDAMGAGFRAANPEASSGFRVGNRTFRMPGMRGQIAGRALLYGLPLGIEYLARGGIDDATRAQQLRALMAAHPMPGMQR